MAEFRDLSTRMTNWETVKKLDSNKDGNVTLAEVKKIDADGDGELSDAELNASNIKDPEVAKALKEKYKAASKTALDTNDTDGSKTNVFTLNDIDKVVTALNKQRNALADEGKTDLVDLQGFTRRAILNAAADANGDGKITLAEMKGIDKEKFKALAKEAGMSINMMSKIDHLDDYIEQLESEGKTNDFEVMAFNTDHDYQSVWTYKNSGGSTEINKAVKEDGIERYKKSSSEAKIPVYESNIKAFEDTIAALEARITELEPKVGPIEAKIATLEAEVAKLEKRDKNKNPPLKPAEKERLAEAKTQLFNGKLELDIVKTELAKAKTDVAENKTDLAIEKADLAKAKSNIEEVKGTHATKKAEMLALAGDNKDITAFIEKMDAGGKLTLESMLYLEKTIKAHGTDKAGKICADLSTFIDGNKGSLSKAEKLTLASDILHDIGFPADIDQSSKGTCAAAAVQMKLAIMDPEKYTKMCTTLANDENFTMVKRTILSDRVLKPNTTYKGDATDDRTLSCKIMQNAFMDYAKSMGSGDDAKIGGKKTYYDSRLSVDGAQGIADANRRKVADGIADLTPLSDKTLKQLGDGLYMAEAESLEEAVFNNKDIDNTTNKTDIIKQINDDLSKGKPIVISVKGHDVLITGLDKTQTPPKYTINSWSGQYEMTEEQLKKVVTGTRYHNE